MGILDQIYQGQEPAGQKVQASPSELSDWNVAATALAVHQSMVSGMGVVGRPGVGWQRTPYRGPLIEQVGSVNIIDSLTISSNYKKLLTQAVLADVRYKATAEDVLEGGIKNGSKVIIKVVPASSGNVGSWDDTVRAMMTDEHGTPTDLTFDKFSVISLSETNEQRHQIHQTFGADIIQTFGRRPQYLTLSGQVLNGRVDVSIRGQIRSMDWKNAFQRLYDKHYSAHACTKRRKKIRIFAQDTIYDGYLLSMMVVTSAHEQAISQVSIQMVLAGRSFGRENDRGIPGFVYESGFAVTGGSVPDDYFPQPNLERFFQGDWTEAIKTAIAQHNEDLADLRSQIQTVAYYGGDMPSFDASSEEFAAALTSGGFAALQEDNFAPVQLTAAMSAHALVAFSPLAADLTHQDQEASNVRAEMDALLASEPRILSLPRDMTNPFQPPVTPQERAEELEVEKARQAYANLQTKEANIRLWGHNHADQLNVANRLSSRYVQTLSEKIDLDKMVPDQAP